MAENFLSDGQIEFATWIADNQADKTPPIRFNQEDGIAYMMKSGDDLWQWDAAEYIDELIEVFGGQPLTEIDFQQFHEAFNMMLEDRGQTFGKLGRLVTDVPAKNTGISIEADDMYGRKQQLVDVQGDLL